ncbi:DegT/DnrJ/EryC1/StrS family aminotransferase [Dehalobacterium formicoaceticum]|uniref:DegT/DnrJ/EryC1/StrS family aminotransferase n=1 Tax=Dehalobacterium formicoaceticum TaxID=51515 RepID=UPI000B7EBC45|nr:DegT/DnrJ/EryC1/StrS family aminotransferase [Dehalobacterium formicoaceticum]
MKPRSIPVTIPSLPPVEEYIAEIKSIWDTGLLTNMGPLHQKLTGLLVDYLNVKNISLFTNGHLALECAIETLQLTGEVITTPFTFASTTHALIRQGLTPVFCDISPMDFTLDTSKMEALITEKTSAIVPVHVYGQVCNVEKIDQIAKKYGLKVIYDAAHAFGVKINGQGIGRFGDISMFSFHATKVFHTIEGGALTFSDSSYEERLSRLKNFGISSPEDVTEVGTNAKMNEFQAAMGICNIRYIDHQIALRKKIVDCYREYLDGIRGLSYLSPQKGVTTNYAYFPVLFDEKEFGKTRNEVVEALKKEDILARKYFYPLTSRFSCYEGRYQEEATPVAKYIGDRILTLPLFGALNLNDVKRICQVILER